MFDIGWSELLLIAVIALIVVGPKELPGLLRVIGRYVGIIRTQAQQFREQVDEAIKDTQLEELRDEMTGLRDDVAGTIRETSETVGRDLGEGEDALNAMDRDLAKGDARVSSDSET